MFLETSARTAYNVEEAFNLSAQTILNNIDKNKVNEEVVRYSIYFQRGVALDAGKSTRKSQDRGGCC